MTDAGEVPSLWDFAVGLYGRPGVAAACLNLQDRLGLDVNLLLFCVWAAAAGPGRLTRGSIAECIALTDPWRQRVVVPLRALWRVGLAGVPPDCVPGGGEVRERLLGLELEAERIELQLLENWAAHQPRSRTTDAAATAAGNLALYLAAAGADMAAAAAGIRQLLAAAAPELSPA